MVRERRTDLGERPEMETVREGRACTWLVEGTSEDVAKAEAYAASPTCSEGARVFVFAVGESDPLGKARAAVIEYHAPICNGVDCAPSCRPMR